jgi:Fur family zinc uptake transcriptional regulator
MTDSHNHQACIDNALLTAERICEERDARLTQLRRQVLRLVWQSHKPLGAYTLMDMLAEAAQRRVAPPTVYRALDFLLDLGLIHRINSLNAYIGCTSPAAHSGSPTNYFFICSQCHNTQEVIDDQLSQDIIKAGHALAFSSQQQWLEVTGLCKQCST